ncbi:hypothetical protein SAMN02746041_00617 [Desulfacinum hydrothermale DSM 13146]|uniref:Small integral membrane protein n=1 Tax=Desulfacinum hydrothermale DSM 13146 TaxID=1121390 RepID=A0A1W1X5A5_9BACT|nr:hypothetical protein [Desulfacinum hydrothermale]SMC19134.1 hypothetical protein SAMN02746041_00617 [Desulfacinum hydrothermale DSM 13146]
MSNWAWRIGMLVVGGVPAIIGGGLFWHLFEKWTAVIVWEIVLLFILSLIISKGDKRGQEAGH